MASISDVRKCVGGQVQITDQSTGTKTRGKFGKLELTQLGYYLIDIPWAVVQWGGSGDWSPVAIQGRTTFNPHSASFYDAGEGRVGCHSHGRSMVFFPPDDPSNIRRNIPVSVGVIGLAL